MSQELSIRQQLEKTPAAAIVNLPSVQERFTQLYKTFNVQDGMNAYQSEKFHFSKIIAGSEKLSACTKLSLYGCFLDMAVSGLSFDPSMKHAYLVPFGVKVKVQGKEIWEQRAQLQISGIGELALRVKQQQIKYADNPVLVYDCDLFTMGTKDNTLFITHEVKLPRAENTKIMACYLRITRNDDSIDYKVLTLPEIEQLKKFSKDPESKAWTIGLPGMIQAKTIKHAFRTYPKLRSMAMTKFSALESDTIDSPAEEVDIYAVDESTAPVQQPPYQIRETFGNVPMVTKDTPRAVWQEPVIAVDDNFAQEQPQWNNDTVQHDDDNF